MCTKESKPDVAESENSTMSVTDLHHCNHENTGQEDQNGESLSQISGRTNGQEHGVFDPVTEVDCKTRSYYHHQDIGEAYSEIRTSVSNTYSCEARSSEHEKINFGQDKNYSGNYHSNGDQNKYFVYSEEHAYQRKNGTQPRKESYLNTDYDYYNKNKTTGEGESTTFPNDSCVNSNNLHSKSQSYIQMSNVPFDDQEPHHQREYEYLEDSTSTKQRSSEVYSNCDRHETCIVREYIYEGSGCVLKEKSDYNVSRACHKTHDTFRYESPNGKNYQDEVTDSPAIQQRFEGHSCIYEPHDNRLYPEGEPTSIEQGQYQSKNCSYLEKNSSTENERMNKTPYKETYENDDCSQGEYNSIIEENYYLCEEKGCFQRNEASAVDLRILRPSTHSLSPPYKICGNQNTNLLNSSHITAVHMGYNEDNSNHIRHPGLDESFDYSVCETLEVENNNLWDAGTNTDHPTYENKDCQTVYTEVRDVAVQTDTENKMIPLALLKNIQEEIIKHICPVCQRVYISKSSFDRHLRTHIKGKNVMTNVRFTTEAKLQICKRSGKNKLNKNQKPIVIQVPRSIFQCDWCEKIFPNEKEKDNHICTFNPFTLTKCPECHIRFYTTGALNEHIEVIHKKENYYCIFCSKSFSAGYNFHLHLDEHLSTQ